MGLDSVVKSIVNALMRNDSANPRALKVWGRRAIKIDEHLNQSNDTERQRALRTTVTTIAQELDRASGSQPDSISNKIEPVIQSERAKIVMRGDEALNQFQDPPPGHSEAMEKAARLDSRELFAQIEGLREAKPDIIVDILGFVEPQGDKQSHEPDLSSPQIDDSLTRVEPPPELQRQQMKHAEIIRKFQAMLESGSREPTIVIHMVAMGQDDAEAIPQLISFNDTFADLSNIILEKDLNLPLPDFWIKKTCGTKNRATTSGVWWEWQRPNIRVLDAIPQPRTGMKEVGVGVKMVVAVGEYVVVLVKKDERECEMPIGAPFLWKSWKKALPNPPVTEIPRAPRKPALDHFQEVFPTDIVGKVVELETGRDFSRVVFDGNTFYHKTNPLFVEVRRRLVANKGKGTMRTTLFPDNQSRMKIHEDEAAN